MTVRKLGRGVAIVGAGMSRFGAFPGQTSRDLFVQAFREMRASVDKGLDARQPAQIAVGTQLEVAFVERGEGDKRRTHLALAMRGASPAPGDQ